MIDAREFVNQTITKASELGFECMVICNNVSAHNFDLNKLLDNNHMFTITPKTFQDIYKFIAGAERDDTGMHTINDGDGKDIPFIGLHIYDNKQQVNICTGKTRDDSISVGNIIFDPTTDEVRFFKVSDTGVADYEHPTYSTMKSNLDHINWEYAFGKNGERIYNLFINLLRGLPTEYILQGDGHISANCDRDFTFMDLWNFINKTISPGNRLTIPNINSIAGEAYIFVRMTEPGIIDFYKRESAYQGFGKRICRFIFKDDPGQKWRMTCTIVNCDSDGKLIESRRMTRVCGDCVITIPDSKEISRYDGPNSFGLYWHYVFDTWKGGKKVVERGEAVRKMLDDILRGWYHK